jgi:hydrogenase nickel incorporation protein HypA/HybF
MHEMGIAMQIVEIATSAIPKEAEGIPVEVVNLKIGKLAGVVPESLTFCFNFASQDSALAGAKLHIEEVPIVARCQDCDAQSVIAKPPFTCHECESGNLDILSGRELNISSIELADSDEAAPAGG